MAEKTASNYPTTLDDVDSLLAFSNSQELTLASGIGSGDTSFVVNEVIANVNVPAYIRFATGEIVFVEAKTDATKTFSTVTRGVQGSAAASHSAAEAMRVIITAENLRQLRKGIIATQTELGTDVAGPSTDLKTRLALALFEGASANTETISATKTLVDGDDPIQFLNPSGLDRTVQLPAEATSNHAFIIVNTGTTYELDIQDDTPTALVSLKTNKNEAVLCVPDGTQWITLILNMAEDTRYLAAGDLFLNGVTQAISAGTFAYSAQTPVYVVQAQTGTADDLDTITGAASGDVILLIADTGDTITITKGTGSNAFDMDTNSTLTDKTYQMFRFDGTNWHQVGGAGGSTSTLPDTGVWVDLTNAFADVIAAPASGTIKKISQILLQNTSATATECHFKIVKSATDYFEVIIHLGQYETFMFEFPIYLDSTMKIQAKAADTVTTARFYAAVTASAKGTTDVLNFTGTSYDTCVTASGGEKLEGIAFMNTYTATEDITFRVYDGVSATEWEEVRTVTPDGFYMAEYNFVLSASGWLVQFKHGAASYTGSALVSYQE